MENLAGRALNSLSDKGEGSRQGGKKLGGVPVLFAKAPQGIAVVRARPQPPANPAKTSLGANKRCVPGPRKG